MGGSGEGHKIGHGRLSPDENPAEAVQEQNPARGSPDEEVEFPAEGEAEEEGR